MRTDLIRARALARAAGEGAGDPSICAVRSTVPRVGTTVRGGGGAAPALGEPRQAQHAPRGGRALAASAALQAMAPRSDGQNQMRDSSFTKTWKVKPRA